MENDTDMILQLFINIAAAWNQGDGNLYASNFMDDCDYITFDGKHLMGRDSNAKFHSKLFSGLLRGSKLIAEIRTIRFIDKNVAIVHQTGAVQLRFQRRPNLNRASINTNVVLKINNEWKVSAFHNSRIRWEGLFTKFFRFISK